MVHFLVILGVWGLVYLSEELLEFTHKWSVRLLYVALGLVGAVCIHPADWWWGFGYGGAAMVLALLTDLLLVVTDRVRFIVLQQAERR